MVKCLHIKHLRNFNFMVAWVFEVAIIVAYFVARGSTTLCEGLEARGVSSSSLRQSQRGFLSPTAAVSNLLCISALNVMGFSKLIAIGIGFGIRTGFNYYPMV